MTAVQQSHPQGPSPATSLRSGADYLKSLNDGRQVYLDGEWSPTSRPPGASAGRAHGGAPVRRRGRAREPRADDVPLAHDRRAGAARATRFRTRHADLARAAAVLRELGRGDLRPDGPHARSRRGLLLRLRRQAERVRRGRPAVRRQRRPLLRARARQAPLCSATRSCRRRSTAPSPRTSRPIRRCMPAW